MAREMKSVVKIGMNSTEFDGSVSEINRRLKLLDSEFRTTTALAKSFGNQTDELKNKNELLTQKIVLQTQKVEKLKTALKKSIEKTGENSKATTEAALKYNAAEQALAKMEAKLEANTTAIKNSETAVGKFGTKITEFKTKCSEMGIQLEQLGDRITKVGLVFTALGVAGGKSFLDFENEFKKTTTLIDETVLSLDEARKGIREISDDSGKAAGDLALAMYDALSSGVETADSMAFLADATDLARAGFTETSVTVDILTTIMNSYGYTISDVKKLSDELILTQDAGKITVGQLGEGFGRVAGLAAQAGVPLEDLLAAIATLTVNGVNANEAITQLRSILSAVIKPTSEARDTARGMGLQFNVAAIESKGLAGFLEDVQKKTRGNSEEFAKLFGNVEGLNASLILTGTGAKEFTEILGQMDSATGRTAAAIAKLEENPGEKFGIAVNKMKNSLIELGDALSPLITVISLLFTILSKLPTPVLTFIAVLGPLLIIVGQIISMVARFQESMGVLSKASTVANLGMKGFGGTLTKIVVTVLAVAAAITVLVLAINALTGKSGAFISQVNALSNVKTNTSDLNLPNYSYASGIDYVPSDRIALIHKGERIQRASENPYNPYASSADNRGDTIILNVNMSEVDEVSKLMKVVKAYKQTKRAGLAGV